MALFGVKHLFRRSFKCEKGKLLKNYLKIPRRVACNLSESVYYFAWFASGVFLVLSQLVNADDGFD